jgi:hypothetical protein
LVTLNPENFSRYFIALSISDITDNLVPSQLRGLLLRIDIGWLASRQSSIEGPKLKTWPVPILQLLNTAAAAALQVRTATRCTSRASKATPSWSHFKATMYDYGPDTRKSDEAPAQSADA